MTRLTPGHTPPHPVRRSGGRVEVVKEDIIMTITTISQDDLSATCLYTGKVCNVDQVHKDKGMSDHSGPSVYVMPLAQNEFSTTTLPPCIVVCNVWGMPSVIVGPVFRYRDEAIDFAVETVRRTRDRLKEVREDPDAMRLGYPEILGTMQAMAKKVLEDLDKDDEDEDDD